MMFAGLCIPVGKLIILEALAVVQLTYFSILMFEKIPPTFIGFKALMISNGYNDQNIFFKKNPTSLSVYRLLGLQQNVFSDYNMSLILLFIIPILIGLIGWIIYIKVKKEDQSLKKQKYCSQNKSIIQPLNDQTSKNKQKQSQYFPVIIFERILFQMSFYGLIVCGYLAWSSIFYSVTLKQSSGFVLLPVLIIIWIVIGYFFIKFQPQKINFRQFTKQNPSLKNQLKQNLQISTKFGQFSEVSSQLLLNNQENSPNYLKKIYLLFIVQRLVSSLIVILIGQKNIGIGSLLLILLYGIFLGGLIFIHKKFRNSISTPSIFSYFYQNYSLRQSINFITIIIIQLILLCVSITANNSGTYETFVKNSLITKGIPSIIISLLFVSVGFNIFLWIWELKSSNLLLKIKFLYSYFFNKKTLTIEIKDEKSKIVSKIIEEDGQVENMMNSFVQTSPIFKCRDSPFLGLSEKLSKKSNLLDGFKLQCAAQASNLQTGVNQIESQLWGQI